MAIKQAVSRLGRGIDGLKTQGTGATCIWTGGGADDLWTNALNWDRLPVAGDDLIFAGTTRLTPSNDFAAATSFASITFAPGAGAFTLSTNQITLTGDILNQSSNAQIIALAIACTQTIIINTDAQSLYLTGVFSGAGGGWEKLGTGTLYVKANCSMTGTITLTEGTQNHGDGGATGNMGAVAAFINNAALVFQRSNNTNSLYSISGTGTVTNNGASGFTNTLSGTNTYTGATRVMAGTLLAGSTSAFGNNSAVTLDNVAGAVLDTTGFANSIGSLTGGGGTGGNITLGAATLTIGGDGTSPAAYGGIISGTGNIIKSGAGTLTLSALNTYTGTTAVQNGTLSVNTILSVSGGASALGAPTTVANGTIALGSTTTTGTLAYTGGVQSTDRVLNLAGTTGGGTLDHSGTGALTFSSNLTATGVGAKTLTLQGTAIAGSAAVISGIIVDGSGTTGVTKVGTGNWVLSGANTYTLATAIQEGVLSVNTIKDVSGGASALGAPTTVANGTISIGSGTTSGVLTYTGAVQSTNRVINLAGTTGGATLRLSSANNLTFTSDLTATGSGSKILTFGGSLAGAGVFSGAISTATTSIIKTGTNTWTLSGTNTFPGQIQLLQGKLAAGSTGAFPSTAAVSISNVASTTLDITGFANSIGSLTGGGGTGGNVTLGAATLTVGGDDTSPAAYGGIISGTGALTKTGSGTLTLSGTNTYTGATTISSGILKLTGSLASGSAVSIVGGRLAGPDTTGASSTAAGTIAITSSASAIIQPGEFGNNTLNTGALTFSGTLAAFIANSTTTTFSKVAVTGNVSLGAMDITCPAGITTNGTYKIITATGTMSGTLPTVVSNLTGKTVVVQQTANDLELVIT